MDDIVIPIQHTTTRPVYDPLKYSQNACNSTALKGVTSTALYNLQQPHAHKHNHTRKRCNCSTSHCHCNAPYSPIAYLSAHSEQTPGTSHPALLSTPAQLLDTLTHSQCNKLHGPPVPPLAYTDEVNESFVGVSDEVKQWQQEQKHGKCSKQLSWEQWRQQKIQAKQLAEQRKLQREARQQYKKALKQERAEQAFEAWLEEKEEYSFTFHKPQQTHTAASTNTQPSHSRSATGTPTHSRPLTRSPSPSRYLYTGVTLHPVNGELQATQHEQLLTQCYGAFESEGEHSDPQRQEHKQATIDPFSRSCPAPNTATTVNTHYSAHAFSQSQSQSQSQLTFERWAERKQRQTALDKQKQKLQAMYESERKQKEKSAHELKAAAALALWQQQKAAELAKQRAQQLQSRDAATAKKQAEHEARKAKATKYYEQWLLQKEQQLRAAAAAKQESQRLAAQADAERAQRSRVTFEQMLQVYDQRLAAKLQQRKQEKAAARIKQKQFHAQQFSRKHPAQLLAYITKVRKHVETHSHAHHTNTTQQQEQQSHSQHHHSHTQPLQQSHSARATPPHPHPSHPTYSPTFSSAHSAPATIAEHAEHDSEHDGNNEYADDMHEFAMLDPVNLAVHLMSGMLPVQFMDPALFHQQEADERDTDTHADHSTIRTTTAQIVELSSSEASNSPKDSTSPWHAAAAPQQQPD